MGYNFRQSVCIVIDPIKVRDSAACYIVRRGSGVILYENSAKSFSLGSESENFRSSHDTQLLS